MIAVSVEAPARRRFIWRPSRKASGLTFFYGFRIAQEPHRLPELFADDTGGAQNRGGVGRPRTFGLSFYDPVRSDLYQINDMVGIDDTALRITNFAHVRFPQKALLQEPIFDTIWIMKDDTKQVKNFLISVAQMRAGRGLLGWSQTKLAVQAGLSEPTVKRFETAGAKVSDNAIAGMRAALESAGVEFIAENGGGPGVRLRKGKPT